MCSLQTIIVHFTGIPLIKKSHSGSTRHCYTRVPGIFTHLFPKYEGTFQRGKTQMVMPVDWTLLQ